MTRAKEITKEAKKFAKEIDDWEIAEDVQDAFEQGAEWADTHPHWVSVEDELPKNKELVFITDGEYTDTGFYEYTFDEWQPCEKWLGDITHWMPLPAPPESGSSEIPNNHKKKGGEE